MCFSHTYLSSPPPNIFIPYPKESPCGVYPRIQESYFGEYCFDLCNTTDKAPCYKLGEMFIKNSKISIKSHTKSLGNVLSTQWCSTTTLHSLAEQSFLNPKRTAQHYLVHWWYSDEQGNSQLSGSCSLMGQLHTYISSSPYKTCMYSQPSYVLKQEIY